VCALLETLALQETGRIDVRRYSHALRVRCNGLLLRAAATNTTAGENSSTYSCTRASTLKQTEIPVVHR
jgi:hypothetical protein